MNPAPDVRERVRHGARGLAVGLGRATAAHRPLPDYLLIGAQRCGTTSLHRALAAHPQIRPPALHKGVHYFDVDYWRGPQWYRAHFPLARPRAGTGTGTGTGTGRTLTGEASPYYLFHPAVAARVAADLPDVRLVVLLRDPVERAFSAHQHELRRGFEDLPFEQALAAEPARTDGEDERLVADPLYRSPAHQHHAYLARGRYAEQLRRFHAAVGPDRLLVLFAEELFADPAAGYARVLRFLGLPVIGLAGFPRLNARPRPPMGPALRSRLAEGFAAHDEDLAALLGQVPPWRR